jgi:glutamate synthase domain-containing protein 3
MASLAAKGSTTATQDAADAVTFDLSRQTLRELNQFLHRDLGATRKVRVLNPDGAHSIAAGVNAPVEIDIDGHAGYYAGGMNQHARILVRGNAGPGVAEGMTSGRVHVKGFASVSAGAAAHGGLLVIEGDTSLRCGISMKGIDIVVGGSVGDFSAFMAQAGRLVICGDAGDALGDSLYEAVIYLRGKVKSLGADAGEQPMTDADYQAVGELLAQAGLEHDPKQFRRIAGKRELYHWNADSNQEY